MSFSVVDKSTAGPEDLVRQETKVVRFLRCILFGLLAVVAVSLAVGCYKLTSTWEEETYFKDFEVISSRLIDNFRGTLTQIMWNANTLGTSISSNADLVTSAPYTIIPLFNELSMGAFQTNYLNHIFWAPLIFNTTEKKAWEEFEYQQLKEMASRNEEICYVCGDPNLEVGLPRQRVDLPVGNYDCGKPRDFSKSSSCSGFDLTKLKFTVGSLQWAGLNAVVQRKDCPSLISIVQSVCQCQPKSTTRQPTNTDVSTPLSRVIYKIGNNGTQPVEDQGVLSPIGQVYPPGEISKFTMYDLFSDPRSREAIEAMIQSKQAVITKSFDDTTPNIWNTIERFQAGSWGNLLFSPVLALNEARVIGSIVLDLDWVFISGTTTPWGSKGIRIVLENSCGQQRTFASDGDNIDYIGEGDLHDPSYSSTIQQSTFDDYRKIQRDAAPYTTGETSENDCAYRIKVYSSSEFQSTYVSKNPRLYALVILAIFAFTSIVFLIYDCYVSRRQRKVMNAALERDEIVASLFPAEVHERLFRRSPSTQTGLLANFKRKILRLVQPEHNLVSQSRHNAVRHRPERIADYFPMVTVVFADISGFTAWSSEREPSQVFELLETVYQAFDALVNRIGIFKVESSGDCYVAAAGIPMYQSDHAVRAVKFAYECVLHMQELTCQLESSLGPSTLSLSIRVGVHSGPVIGGVLRGKKSRFQLFGDTMNTASRMQTTGEINMIQISSATANLLKEANKSSWIQPRDERVRIKGKGLVETFWADPFMSDDEHSEAEGRECVVVVGDVSRSWGATRLSNLVVGTSSEDKIKRLIEWNTDLLFRLLKKLVATRLSSNRRRSISTIATAATENFQPIRRHSRTLTTTAAETLPFDDVVETLSIMSFNEQVAKVEIDPDQIIINENVRSQLLDYVAAIASMYRENPFHNFEHASHVAMSAAKIVMRIVNPKVGSTCQRHPNQQQQQQHQHSNSNSSNSTSSSVKARVAMKREAHDHTFGISSDVLLQFAVVFSAVIHDVDHRGISNAQLIQDDSDIARHYNQKCVAEQNSVVIAWDLLMQVQYQDLLACICPDDNEKQRFRHFLVNAVIATDIADAELQQERKGRWDRAFSKISECSQRNPVDNQEDDDDVRVTTRHNDGANKTNMDRRATIVFEYIIQASDVAHTMQHWKVYQQWNERLFEERYVAYLQGRVEEDPSVAWHKGEIWFFDNYVIPLAKKLETCGVFGVCSDEYLNYALENRHEWSIKGEKIVASMIRKFQP